MAMISDHNTKLGKIPNWSLPPMISCPGSTSLCESACYVGGKKGYLKMYPSVRDAYKANLEDVSWSIDVMRYLSKRKPTQFRIHVSGDFHSAAYTKKWSQIVSMFPQTQFLAFTRSWRVARLRASLETLRNLPNMQLIASCDPEAYNAPENWRKAHMGDPTSKAMLCPGYGPKELKCDACGLCFRPVKVDVYFPIH